MIDPGGMLQLIQTASVRSRGQPVACQPTVTDANVVLGRLNPVTFWEALLRSISDAPKRPSKIALRVEYRLWRSRRVVAIADHSIAQAIRFVTVQRGTILRICTYVGLVVRVPARLVGSKELGMSVPVPGKTRYYAYGVLTKDSSAP